MKWFKTKFVGVRFREHHERKFKRRADRSIVIQYRRNGKLIAETLGWESQGHTIDEAARIRGEILKNIRLGEGFQSLREKREIEESRRQETAQNQAEKERENTPFSVLGERFLEWSKANKKSWRQDESWYQRHIEPELGEFPIRDIKTLTLERFKKNLQKKELSPKSIQNILTLIRAMYNRAPGWELYSGPNPVTETARVDRKFLQIPDNKRLRFLSDEEENLLLQTLKERSQQWHDISVLSLDSGLRAGECFKLTWADLDFRNETIMVRDPKNNQNRVAFMTVRARKMLSSRKPENPKRNQPVFLDTNGAPIKEVSRTFERVISELGFNEGVNDRRDRIVFHSLRHTFCSRLAQNGEPLQVIQELAGHKSIQMTLRYSHLAPDIKREAVRRLSKNEN